MPSSESLVELSLSAEQRELMERVRDFARRELNDGLIEREARSEFSREAWSKCAALGIQGLPFPVQYGGGGADVVTTVAVMEALGYGCRDAGLIFGINAQMWSVQMPILHFGTEEQKRRYLPKLNAGEWIGAHGMTEPNSGSDAFALATTARKQGDGYVLNGTKTFVTNAPVADVFVVFATTDPRLGFMGLTAFVLERSFSGLSVGRAIPKMGLRTSPMAEVVLDECLVPVENRLGPEGAGAQVFRVSMEWERACILASYVGTMERQLENCVRYARERKQFGRSIGKFQSVANRIVDMKLRLETSRHLIYRVAARKARGEDVTMDAALAKLHVSESFVQSSLDAIQIHGGYGYTTEFEVERDLRDAVAARLYSGTSEMQRNIIAAGLGL